MTKYVLQEPDSGNYILSVLEFTHMLEKAQSFNLDVATLLAEQYNLDVVEIHKKEI